MGVEVKVDVAIIMAGGKGTRLRPLTNNIPKPLLPILGRPCAEYFLRALADAGVARTYLACGYRHMDMVRTFRDGGVYGLDIVFSFEEEPMGTAGAVKLLQDKVDGTFIVGSGDVLADVDMAELVAFHRRSKAEVTIALTEVEDPTAFGIVGLDQHGRIERFKEKPLSEEAFSNLINAGIYVLEPHVLDLVPEDTKYDFSKQLFPDMLERGMALYGHRLEGLWKDIGRPADLLEANLLMAERAGAADVSKGVMVIGGVHIDGSATVAAGVILDRAVLGGDVRIGAGARLTRALVLDGCEVAADAIIEGSVLGPGCVIGSGVKLTDCVLAEGVRVMSGEHRGRTLE